MTTPDTEPTNDSMAAARAPRECPVCHEQVTANNFARHLRKHVSEGRLAEVQAAGYNGEGRALGPNGAAAFEGDEPTTCEECGKPFDTYAQLLGHLSGSHGRVSTKECPICHEVMDARGWRSHLESHGQTDVSETDEMIRSLIEPLKTKRKELQDERDEHYASMAVLDGELKKVDSVLKRLAPDLYTTESNVVARGGTAAHRRVAEWRVKQAHEALIALHKTGLEEFTVRDVTKATGWVRNLSEGAITELRNEGHVRLAGNSKTGRVYRLITTELPKDES